MVTAAKTTSAIGVHMIVAFATMYVVTGSAAFGGLAAILEPIINVIVMPAHERIWEKIRGRLESKNAQPAPGTYHRPAQAS